MMNLINKKKAEQGFTLIELMIVIAIIGILAAIALPQFAAYRMRAFNSTSEADARNLSASTESVFADYNQYAKSRTATGVVGAANLYIVDGQWIGTSTAIEELQVTLSSKVTGMVNASATGPGGWYDSSVGFAKHTAGDKIGAFDTDVPTAFWRVDSTTYANVALSAGQPAADVTAVAATVNADDLGATFKQLQQ